MVILEVLSEAPPFVGDKEFIVMRKVIEGERPERPEGAWFTDSLWRTMEQCWLPQPNDRPFIEAVLECLGQVSTVRQSLPPIPEDVKTDGDVSVSTINRGRFLHFASKPLLTTEEDVSESVQDPPMSDKVGITIPYDQIHLDPRIYYRTYYTNVLTGKHQGRQVIVRVLRVSPGMDPEKIQNVGHFLNFSTVDFKAFV